MTKAGGPTASSILFYECYSAIILSGLCTLCQYLLIGSAGTRNDALWRSLR